MSIVGAELKFYKSEVFNDTGTNGGRMSTTESVSAVIGNMFPDASEAERIAGSDKYRKLFMKNANDDDLILHNPKIYIENYTPGQDEVFLAAGTQTDTQDTFTGGSPSYFGAGQLNTNYTAGDPTIEVSVHDGSIILFRNGDSIRVSDKTDINDTGNNAEYRTVSGTPNVVGNLVTITLSAALDNSYSSSDTRVTSLYEPSDVTPSIDNDIVTTAGSGTFNKAEVTLDNIGSIEQSITLTFTSSSQFNASSDVAGSLGTGSVGSTFAPTNADFSKPYFSIPASAWGGTYATNDTVTFDTHPAAVPLWYYRNIPAGTPSQANNKVITVVEGESE